MEPVVFTYLGKNYLAMNGRWKQASDADLVSLAYIGLPAIPTYAVPNASSWTNLQHCLGTPGPL